jgi:type IV secretion system protein VirB6/type IV secretion system protein TrbL
MKIVFYRLLLFGGALFFTPRLYAQAGATVVDSITTQYQDSALSWILSIQQHAEDLFWILAAISAVWTFIVLVLRQSDLADFVGAVVRFILTTIFFYWLLDNGPNFASKILASTLHLATDATGINGAGWVDFVNLGMKIFMDTAKAVSLWNPVQAVLLDLVAIGLLVALSLITVNLVLVNCETYVTLAAGTIFLGFGASEWTRELSISYFKHLLGVGIKQFVTLLLAAIALNVMQSIDASHAAAGWGYSLQDLGLALVSSVILLVLVSKVPSSVAAICGVPVGAAGTWGISTLFAGAQTGAQAAALASNFGGATLAAGRQLGSAVRNAVKQGQALSRGKS